MRLEVYVQPNLPQHFSVWWEVSSFMFRVSSETFKAKTNRREAGSLSVLSQHMAVISH